MKKEPDWTNHQVAKLQKMAGRESVQDIAACLNRSESAIRTKASLMGLSVSTRRPRKKEPRPMPQVYTPQVNCDTIRTIRRMVKRLGIEAVAKRLNLKPESIRQKIYPSQN